MKVGGPKPCPFGSPQTRRPEGLILVHLEIVEDWGVNLCWIGASTVNGVLGTTIYSKCLAWRSLRSVLAGSAALAEPAWSR